MSYAIKRGVSLYSYQDEFYTGKMNLEDCIRAAAEAGATGVEFLPEQMLNNFPELTGDFFKQWFEWMEKYNVEPVAYDAFLETKLYGNRMLTRSESVKLMKRDIALAGKLGCKVLRTLVSTPLEVVKDSLGFAEEHNVKIALEVHAPFTFGTPWFEERLDFIKESGTKWFGIMPDLGVFVKRMAPVMSDFYIRKGGTPEIIALINENYENGGDRKAFLEQVKQMKDATEMDKKYAELATHIVFTKPQILLDNIPYIMHVHGKFYEMDESLQEPSIPYKDILDALKQGGYNGYICSEYEGNRHIQDYMEVDSVTQVRRHQMMLQQLIG
ncbi:sugar phosphate isomerase/epimerase family protein [Paenibacillus piscarius]|uniref:sugar phosphate isomerase/epimerase family protein n=1 Tax=Paenibacillus piscarius TaxID=1089681 RepID=UPI001EE94FC9|nr:TIM barrel protein [Paenibacillus piscarius]